MYWQGGWGKICQGCFPVISFPVWDWWKQSPFLFQESLTHSWQQPPWQMSHKRGCPWALCVWSIYQCPRKRSSCCPSSCQCPTTGTSRTGSPRHQSLLCPAAQEPVPTVCHSQLVYYLVFQGCCQALLTPWKDLHWDPVINKHSGSRELWQIKVPRLLLIIYWMQKLIWSDI